MSISLRVLLLNRELNKIILQTEFFLVQGWVDGLTSTVDYSFLFEQIFKYSNDFLAYSRPLS